jgi:hypothetical protein
MGEHAQGKSSVLAALVGNVFLAIIKIAVSLTTGSVSMFAESVHSVADTLNQSLLFIGIERSKKPADSGHGYGYGIERFFWSLVSACGVLFIGAGITIYHSVESLFSGNTAAVTVSVLSVPVLAIALIVEGITLWLAIKELQGEQELSIDIFSDADPVLLAIIYEDGVRRGLRAYRAVAHLHNRKPALRLARRYRGRSRARIPRGAAHHKESPVHHREAAQRGCDRGHRGGTRERCVHRAHHRIQISRCRYKQIPNLRRGRVEWFAALRRDLR